MKYIRTVTIFLLIFNGVSALAGGSSLILDPTGKSIGMPVTILSHSPFGNFLIPGILLYVINGLSSILIAIAVIIRMRHSSYLISLQGLVSLSWIVIQVILIRSVVLLHYVYGGLAVLLIIAGILLKSRGKAV
jgi:hypothetical protein